MAAFPSAFWCHASRPLVQRLTLGLDGEIDDGRRPAVGRRHACPSRSRPSPSCRRRACRGACARRCRRGGCILPVASMVRSNATAEARPWGEDGRDLVALDREIRRVGIHRGDHRSTLDERTFVTGGMSIRPRPGPRCTKPARVQRASRVRRAPVTSSFHSPPGRQRLHANCSIDPLQLLRALLPADVAAAGLGVQRRHDQPDGPDGRAGGALVTTGSAARSTYGGPGGVAGGARRRALLGRGPLCVVDCDGNVTETCPDDLGCARAASVALCAAAVANASTIGCEFYSVVLRRRSSRGARASPPSSPIRGRPRFHHRRARRPGVDVAGPPARRRARARASPTRRSPTASWASVSSPSLFSRRLRAERSSRASCPTGVTPGVVMDTAINGSGGRGVPHQDHRACRRLRHRPYGLASAG